MAKMEKSVFVRAPVEQVFGYMDEPTTLPEIWPSLLEASDVRRLPNGGKEWAWVYKMAGLRYEGASTDAEWEANQRVVSKTKGGVESTITWTYQPEDGGTKVTVEAEYSVPVPLVGKLAEAFIVKVNEHEGELLLANLKARMEV